MEATVYDYRTDTPGSDVGFLTETISEGLVQLSGQVGGLPNGFITTVTSPTDPNKNTYTWDVDKLEIGQKLPVYYIPYENIDTKEKVGNADNNTLYVTPDNMYYTIESVSEDKRTITLKFHGDYSKPGRIVTSFKNPMEDFLQGKSSRLGINFDKDTWTNVPGTVDNSTLTVAKADGSPLTNYEFKATSKVDSSYGEEDVVQVGQDRLTSQAVRVNYDATATGIPVETSNPEQINKGTVIVQYVDVNGNVLQQEKVDVADVDVDTDYDTVTDNRPQEITVGDKTYELVPAGDYTVGSVSDQGNLTTSKLRDVYASSDVNGVEPTGKVTQGTNYVTYVYKEKPAVVKEGTVTVNYKDEEGNVIKDPVVDTPTSPVDTPYNTTDNRPEKITTEDGKTYQRVPEKTEGTEEGNVVEGNTDVTYVYKEVKGDVIVHYIDTEGNVIADDATDTPTTSTGTDYNTADDNKPNTITKDGVTYELVPALTKGNETGKVVEGTTEVTYVYKKVEEPTPEAPTGDVIVHYKDEEGNTIADDKVDTQGSKIDTPYDTTDNRPERITTPDGKTYERVPEKTEGTETGNVVEGTTEVTYVYKEVKGDVIVHYIDTEGNVIADDATDTPTTSTGTDYNTADDNKPNTITKDGVTYELVPALTKGNETGKVVEGTTEVTYVYKKVEAPVQPEPTPEAPTGDVIVHYVDEEGNTIADDKVDTQGSKIDTPYDTTDNRPERITTPDGKTYERVPEKTEGTETGSVVEGTTEVTYVYKEVKGDVIVHYIDTEGNVIADDAVDTPETSTGTDYNTADDNKPTTITKDGVKYELVPVLTKGNEQGEVVEGTTEITYVYKKVEEPTTPEVPNEDPGKYIPYIPVDPENPTDPNDPLNPPVDPNTGDPIDPIDYDETPEDPTDNPPIPDVDGFIPVDPNDPTEPLKPKDPNDPTQGYEPPVPTDPNEDTPIPYVPAGMVTVHYVDEDGNVIKDPTVDTAKSPVGTEYNTNENGTEIPKEITGKDGKVYEYVKVKDGDSETGKVVKGNTDVTYIYKVKDPTTPEVPNEDPGKYIPYIPVDPENPTDPNDPLNPPVDPNTGDPIDPIDYDETPEDPTDNPPIPDVDGYIPVDPKDPTQPLKPKDPNDPTKGYEPPKPVDPKEDTPVPYVPAGSITVHYVDEDGNVIKDPTVDTPKSPVGTEYNTNENGEEIPKEIIGKDGKVYVLVKVKDGDEETGKVGKGNKDVTYIYKLKEDPENPTTPEKPEEPNKPEQPKNPGNENPGN
ncbi:MAG: MucBP domain-containing protein, partial [Staphylococcus rostri]|uniref:MucBP domain-containing protein n=1 Tax=Staphylococcus rostri TaxID=522262 RepID=UPI0026E04DE2